MGGLAARYRIGVYKEVVECEQAAPEAHIGRGFEPQHLEQQHRLCWQPHANTTISKLVPAPKYGKKSRIEILTLWQRTGTGDPGCGGASEASVPGGSSGGEKALQSCSTEYIGCGEIGSCGPFRENDLDRKGMHYLQKWGATGKIGRLRCRSPGAV